MGGERRSEETSSRNLRGTGICVASVMGYSLGMKVVLRKNNRITIPAVHRKLDGLKGGEMVEWVRIREGVYHLKIQRPKGRQ